MIELLLVLIYLNQKDLKNQGSNIIFNEFLEKHPEHSLVPNVIYWVGETLYNQKKHAESILTFKKVYNKFPKDPKALAAILKVGYAYSRKGNIFNAKFYLNNLIKRAPQSKEANLAKKRLDSLNVSN